ncbi:hypothetical protein BS78_02G213500 [Paspalum vaginatum]|nr:hypothetical protein BS78_02G213500 [Paspalum vaginatum]
MFIPGIVIFLMSFLFFPITRLHLSWSCGSIGSQGIITSVVIICVVFASTIDAAGANVTPLSVVGFDIITTHRGAQTAEAHKEAKDNKMKRRSNCETTEGAHTPMLLQNSQQSNIAA